MLSDDAQPDQAVEAPQTQPPRTQGLFGGLAGWLLAGALVYGPFALGGAPQFAIDRIAGLLIAAFASVVLDCIFRRRWPHVPWFVLVSAAMILVCGWLMTWNARTFLMIARLTPPRPALPGAVELLSSRLAMLRMNGLAAGIVVACDLGASPFWRRRWAVTIASTGAAIAAIGVAQRGGAASFLAARMSQLEGEYFATFNYHGNAGAYLNLGLAMSAALTAGAFAAPGKRWPRVWHGGLTLVILCGVLVNTSRGAQAVAAAVMLGLGAYLARAMASRGSRRFRPNWPIVVVALLLIGGAASVSYARNARKWRELPVQIARDSSRWQVWRVEWPMAASTGMFGHGPGSFKMLLPRSPRLTGALYSRWIIQPYIPGAPISMWSMAHNDYLQTIIEYGWLGAALFAVILFGGLACGIARLRRETPPPLSADWCAVSGAVAGLIGVMVHALFDFPLQMASIQVTVVALLGICYGARYVEGSTECIKSE